MLISPISYNDTNRFKGMAILLIVLHNFYHVLPQAPIENEFFFNIENTNYYLKSVIDSFSPISITSLFTDFFSFFGHYGVALFISLSGYGLTIKYSSKEFSNIEKIHFIWKRILRFWKVIIPLIPLSVLVKMIKYGNGLWETLTDHIGEYLSIITFTQTLIPGKEFVVSGPWWFFGAILQLYIIYIFLLHKKSNRFLLIISLSALFIQAITIFWGWENILFRLRYNSIGWLPIFCLGIYYAKKPVTTCKPSIPIILMILFLCSNVNAYFWLFSSLLFPLAFIPLFRNFPIKSFWEFMGKISFYLFAIHSFIRGAFFGLIGEEKIVEQNLGVPIGILYLLTSILIAYIFQQLLNRIYTYCQTIIVQKKQ